MESLALAYRPRTFDDLVGQSTVQVFLRQMVASNAVPHALLFCGPRGTGKTTTARILGAALNCEGSPIPCGRCVSCKNIFNASSLDVLELDAASNGGVEDIRSISQQVRYAVGGTRRVIVLDEAQSMSTAAFNALLKVLEEPPPGVVFILCTTEPTKILGTVVSRCMRFDFRRIALADIISRLRHIVGVEQRTVEPELLTLIANRAEGGLRDAVMMLDQSLRADITTVSRYTAVTGDTDLGPVLVAALRAGNHATSYGIVEEYLHRTGDPRSLVNAVVHTLRDILVLRCDGTLPHTGDALAARTQLAERIDSAQAVSAMRVIWELKTKLGNDDHHTVIDLAVTLIGELFAKTAPTVAAPAPAGKLTLQQMKDMQ